MNPHFSSSAQFAAIFGGALLAVLAAASPHAIAGALASHPLAFNDGNGPADGAWSGTTAFVDSSDGLYLSGAVDWAVFPSEVFPFSGMNGWGPESGQLTYAYQVFTSGPEPVEWLRLSTSMSNSTNGGAFDLGGESDIVPASIAYEGFGLLTFRFADPLLSASSVSAGLVFNSDRIPSLLGGQIVSPTPGVLVPPLSLPHSSATIYSPSSADFDEDGDVDGMDFLKWQRGETTPPLDAGDLALWQDEYGLQPPVSTKVVPEPSMLGLMILGLGCLVPIARCRIIITAKSGRGMSHRCIPLFVVTLVTLQAMTQVHAQFITVINIPSDAVPSSVGSDTQLNLGPGGSLGDSFEAGVSGDANNIEINIAGGVVSSGFRAAPFDGSGGDVIVNISGGTIGSGFLANPGGSVFIAGGEFEDVTAFGGLVQIMGGQVSSSLNALNGGILEIEAGGDYSQAGVGSFGAEDGTQSTVRINGGSFPFLLSNPNLGGSSIVWLKGGTIAQAFVFSGTEFNMLGGTITELLIYDGNEFNLFGTRFFLNEVEITDSLNQNAPTTIHDRDRTLSGVLADGTVFSYDLSGAGGDYFSPFSTLTVTRILANSDTADFDGDGDVDGADFLKWQRGETSPPLNADSLFLWHSQLGTSSMSSYPVPEPSMHAVVILSIGLSQMVTSRMRSHGCSSTLTNELSKDNSTMLQGTQLLQISPSQYSV